MPWGVVGRRQRHRLRPHAGLGPGPCEPRWPPPPARDDARFRPRRTHAPLAGDAAGRPQRALHHRARRIGFVRGSGDRRGLARHRTTADGASLRLQRALRPDRPSGLHARRLAHGRAVRPRYAHRRRFVDAGRRGRHDPAHRRRLFQRVAGRLPRLPHRRGPRRHPTSRLGRRRRRDRRRHRRAAHRGAASVARRPPDCDGHPHTHQRHLGP